MSIILSFRDKNGQFLKHSSVLGSAATRIGGVIAMVIIERYSGAVLDKIASYAIARKARKEAEKNTFTDKGPLVVFGPAVVS